MKIVEVKMIQLGIPKSQLQIQITKNMRIKSGKSSPVERDCWLIKFSAVATLYQT